MSDNPPTVIYPDNILITNIGLVCLKVNQTGACETWALMKQPEPLLSKLSKEDANRITIEILGVIIFAWVFVVIKRAI